MLNPYNEKIDKLYVTSPCGYRYFSGANEYHKGIDIVSYGNKEVTAIGSGKIGQSTIISDRTNLSWQWGNYIRIDLDTGERAYYCHLSKRLKLIGDRVEKGDVIGVEGATGYVTGSHLHLEVRPRGAAADSINAADFIGCENAVGPLREVDCTAYISKLCGFEQVTLSYLQDYQFADDFFRKIYAKLKGCINE